MQLIWLSLIPCLIWLAFFYFQDWYQREPVWLILVTFLLGAASALVALVLNTMGTALAGPDFITLPLDRKIDLLADAFRQHRFLIVWDNSLLPEAMQR